MGSVLSVGRLTPEKRVEDMVAAFWALPTPAMLAVVGDEASAGGYLERLRRLAPAVQIESFQAKRRETTKELAAGRLDFAVDAPLNTDPQVRHVKLMEDRYRRRSDLNSKIIWRFHLVSLFMLLLGLILFFKVRETWWGAGDERAAGPASRS